MRNDLYIAEPENPAAANADVIWFNSAARDFEDFDGFVGDLLFDQWVNLFVETAAQGGNLHIMNGGGLGNVVAANMPTPVRIRFLGQRTQLRLRTGDTPPTIWHANGRVIKGDIGGPATGTDYIGWP